MIKASNLNKKEKQILFLISIGFSTEEIAKELFLGFETIKSYRRKIMIKKNANNVAELVRIGFENNLLSARTASQSI